MPTLCPLFAAPCRVDLQSMIVAFISQTLSFFETIISIIIVDDNTIVLHKIE